MVPCRGSHYNVQIYGTDMREKENRNSLSIVKKGRSGDLRAEMNSSCGWSIPLPAAIEKSQPRLVLLAMSGSIAVQQQGSMSMSKAHSTIKDYSGP